MIQIKTNTAAALVAVTIVAATSAVGCSSVKSESGSNIEPVKTETATVASSETAILSAIPKARIYKTNGDYNDRVPVTLDESRTTLVSYPAPIDVAGGQPISLDAGFLLDKRGVSQNTAFTRWTYSEYSALSSTPSAEEILNNIIPEARVTELYEMPFRITTDNIAERCNELINSNLAGCKSLILKIQTLE